MDKILDLNKSVFDLCDDDLTIRSTLLNLGFKAIAAPKTAGIMKTRKLWQICPIRGTTYEQLLQMFEEKGYTIVGKDDGAN